MILADTRCTMHVQRGSRATTTARSHASCSPRCRTSMRPADLVVWPYASFPFGMGLDYERKFTY